MVPNVADYKVEEKASVQMNNGPNNGENAPPTAPGSVDDNEQRKRRKKKKNKSKGLVANGSEEDSRELILNETMSSMGTNGDDVALDLKDPDSLSRSKARRVRRKRLKERNTNCNEGALDDVAADDKGAAAKRKVVVQESAFKPTAPTNTNEALVTVESRTGVLVSDDEDQLVEQDRQTTPVNDVDCTIHGLETTSHAPNMSQLAFVESTSTHALDLSNKKDVLDKQEHSTEVGAISQMVEGEAAAPVVNADSLMRIDASPEETAASPATPESQSPTAEEGLVSLDAHVSHQPLREEETLKTPEGSIEVAGSAAKVESEDKTQLVDAPSQPSNCDDSLAITEESSDVQAGIPAATEEFVDKPKKEEKQPSESQAQQSDLPLDQATPPQLPHHDDDVILDEGRGPQPCDEVPLTTSRTLHNESHQTTALIVACDGAQIPASKTQASLAYTDDNVKADKEDCGCASCNIM